MNSNLDELDQTLIKAILALDTKAVKSTIRAGANVMHTRSRDGLPIGPSVTPVILSHRMKDVVEDPNIKNIRKFPPKVLALLKSRVAELTDTLGEDQVKTRIKEICKVIARKIGL
ncbi:hypothetical protein SH528x_004921 [Novipirellula sp. SH528]|uniref:hypothetical protein n=1 Tax=Novipirellula sp. SH528 TaxID=3454466 RepID=UPI003F9ECC77